MLFTQLFGLVQKKLFVLCSHATNTCNYLQPHFIAFGFYILPELILPE